MTLIDTLAALVRASERAMAAAIASVTPISWSDDQWDRYMALIVSEGDWSVTQ